MKAVESQPLTTRQLRARQERADIAAYGDGCLAGYLRARAWINDPGRGDPNCGGTLSKHVFELSATLAEAATALERSHGRGVIVGFCYWIECPAQAMKLEALAARRNWPAAKRVKAQRLGVAGPGDVGAGGLQ